MANRPLEQVPVEDIYSALASLDPEVQGGIIDFLHQQAAERETREAATMHWGIATDIAVAFRRTNADNPRNIEGWYESLEFSSNQLLMVAGAGTALEDEVMLAAREAAARFSLLLGLRAGRDIDIMATTYEKAGVDVSALIDSLKEVAISNLESYSPKAREKFGALATIDDLKGIHLDIWSWANIYEDFTKQPAERLEQALEEKGIIFWKSGLCDEECRQDNDLYSEED